MRRLSAPVILAIGLAGLLLYAYPGYMSYDSVLQLLQARSGVYGGGHPPMMAVLWGITDRVIAGPFGMLLIQAVCFLGGSYLLLRRCMSDRAAAICASLLLWFPPVAAVMAVIWKDSQMAAYLVLGTALVLSPRRGVRLVGLSLLSLATAMRYNALAVTLPLVLLLFVWSPAHRWWQRYALALAAWFLVTVTASFVNARLVDDTEDLHLWHDSLALMDLTGTLRYAPDLSDAALREDLAGTPLIATENIQATARGTFPAESIPDKKLKTFGLGKYVRALWVTTHHVFAVPTTDAERAAIARAWRQLVLGHSVAYLHHRWRVF
ncbi:MAG: hypothetical protein H6Q90_7079, partial [Deltaproteobacteria bacterium]|nr:hypothetical protein [Deltaproteobacteria bacterium]